MQCGRESKVIALAPVGQGANTGVNALRISSNTHLLILRGMLRGMPFDTLCVDCIQGIADSILLPCHGKGPCVDRCPSFIKQGDSLSILDHRRRMRTVDSQEMHRSDDTKE